MSGFEQMKHLMDHHVFQQVLGFLHQFGVQADVPRPGIAAAPLSLHALEEVAGHLELMLTLMLLYH